MYFSNLQIVFQEVPDEISIALSISGCNIGCFGCHSKETWKKDYGQILTIDVFKEILNKYKNLATTILFYGGEWNNDFIKYINIAKNNNYKIALYTGLEITDLRNEIVEKLDYLKTGRYIKELGALDSLNTNQRFYLMEKGNIKEDLTKKFKK